MSRLRPRFRGSNRVAVWPEQSPIVETLAVSASTSIELQASDAVRKRGADLHRRGRVRLEIDSADEVIAEVQGSAMYRVRIDRRARTTSCTCPAGWEDRVCKHVVAVVLTLEEGPVVVEDKVGRFLRDRTTAELMAIIETQRRADARFDERLEAMAMAASGVSPDLAEWKKRVTAAFGRGFVDYRAAPQWAGRVTDMLGAVRDLATAEHHETVAVLAEHAHKRSETAIGRVDDSAGWITDIANEIGDLHLRACSAGAFSPKALADRLVKLELGSELDTFRRSALRYQEALGEDGLARFAVALERGAAKVPDRGSRWGGGGRIRDAKVGLALATGDPEGVVRAVTPFDGPLDYAEVVEAFEGAGRLEEALDWADRGLADLAGSRWNLELIAEPRARVLARLGRDADVAAMWWERFAERPTLESANRWSTAAVSSGGHDADAASAAIEAFVRSRLPEPGEPQVRRPAHHPAAYDAARVLIAHGSDDGAWEVALTHGASREVWHSLAEARRRTAPSDAVAVLAAEIEELVSSGRGKPAYRNAVKVLAQLRSWAVEAERPDLVEDVIAGVRDRHGNKPSLMSLWPAT